MRKSSKLNKISKKELEKISAIVRENLQNLLHDSIPTKTLQAEMAKLIGKSESMVSKMVHNGEGGLDNWVKALAITRKLDIDVLIKFQHMLRELKPLKRYEKIFFSLKNELNATDEELEFILLCGQEAIKIKRELENSNKVKST